MHRADNLMLRCEMESPWGYGQIVSWYEPPSETERAQVQNAIAEIGCPPTNTLDQRRLATLFLDYAHRLTGPTRRSAPPSTGREAGGSNRAKKRCNRTRPDATANVSDPPEDPNNGNRKRTLFPRQENRIKENTMIAVPPWALSAVVLLAGCAIVATGPTRENKKANETDLT